jgi:predicted metal-dependent phosphoesterase TrpH
MTDTRRADLHVHTCHSKVCGTLKFLGSRDSYSRPEDVYRVAKARGMDLVAFTDHDSIDGALELLSARPELDDVIIGEEVSCWLPDSGVEVHFGAYGMSERIHRELQPLRRNAFDVAACLREAEVFFALNHLLHFYRGQIPFETYLRLLASVPALEVRNGSMLPAHNLLIEQIVGQSPATNRLGVVAGSDAHTLRRVGRTWTAAPGRTRDEFMASLSQGLGRPGGDHGGARAVAGDVSGVIASYISALAGFGPQDIRGWRRAGCLAFSAMSLPGQLVFPLAVASARKSAERREVRRAAAYLAAVRERPIAPDQPSASVQIVGRRRESGA